jgi:restriction system protein
MGERVLWGLHHAGGLPLLDEGSIAIGWPRAGDLTGLPDEREAFKDHLRHSYEEKSEAWIANAAGQLLRFRHLMQAGDLVVYPQKDDRTVNLGEIGGEYRYDPAISTSFPNRRSVDWIAVQPREAFSQGSLYELGAAMSVFRVKTHARQLLEVLGEPDRAAT